MSENSLAGAWRHPPDALVRLGRAVRARQVPLLMLASIASGAVLLVGRLDQGWWSHDDGSLAHAAERVLSGELPHRDFAELYTGLLTFLNAGVFAVLGEDLFNLRIPLFVLFLGFIACFFALARRLVPPIWAFVATLAAITWSVPVYPVPIPSWYLLFLFTAGTYAILRFFETGRRRWLFVAGALGGVAVAVKIVGVWFVVAALLLVVAARVFADETERADDSPRGSHGLALFVGSLAAIGLVFAVLAGQFSVAVFATLGVPLLAVCGTLAVIGWGARRRSDGAAGERRLMPDVATFLIGCLVPLFLFVLPYLATGSVDDLVNGVLITPRSRFEFASYAMPDMTSLLWAVPVAALLVARALSPERRRLVDIAGTFGLIVLVVTATSEPSYEILWNTSRALGPVVLLFGAIAIARIARRRRRDHATVVTLVLVATFWSLNQFPFSAPVYFCYAAPLVLLAGIAAFRALGGVPGLLPCALLVALAVFGYRQLDHQYIGSLGAYYAADPQVEVLDPERASVRVTPRDARDYAAIRQLVSEHKKPGRPIFAGPETPEVYFLTESDNPTRVLMDFLDGSNAARGSRLIDLLRKRNVPVVVINHEPEQSPRLAESTVRRLRALYPTGRRVGPFEVRWLDR